MKIKAFVWGLCAGFIFFWKSGWTQCCFSSSWSAGGELLYSFTEL